MSYFKHGMTGTPMGLMIPKDRKIELPKHLEYVRSLPSIASGNQGCVPHHLLLGWGRKAEKR